MVRDIEFEISSTRTKLVQNRYGAIAAMTMNTARELHVSLILREASLTVFFVQTVLHVVSPSTTVR
jgi:hypothetical protein